MREYWTPAEEARARDDVLRLLDSPDEATAVLTALQQGRIDGNRYTGQCACLIGTIAEVRECGWWEVDGDRYDTKDMTAAEAWFVEISPGDTPENCYEARLAAEWIQEWLDEHTPATEWADAIDELAQAPDLVAV